MKSGEVRSSQVRSSQLKLGEVKTGKSRSGLVWSAVLELYEAFIYFRVAIMLHTQTAEQILKKFQS